MIDRAAWDDYCQQRQALGEKYRPIIKSSEIPAEERSKAWEDLYDALTALRKKFNIVWPLPEQRASEYKVSIFSEEDDPEGELGLWHYSLTVAYRGRGLWAVLDGSNCLSKSGTWDYEMRPSSREDDWLAEHRFPLGEALELARKTAPHMEINGRSASEVKIELHMKEKTS